MADVTVKQCDRCKAADAKTWEILTPTGVNTSVDLCTACAGPVNQAAQAGRRIAQRRTSLSRHESRRIGRQKP
jgi:hypothetical protein